MPEIEAREAAAFVHLSWPAFRAQDIGEQATQIAHYRMHQLIERNANDATIADMERRSRQAQAAGPE